MQAAVLLAKGAAPRVDDFADPEPGRGQVVVDVTAAGVHHADLAKAAGSFGEPDVPCVLGTDGVGRTESGRRVFFDSPVAPYGSYAQRTLVPEENLLEVAEGVDDVTAA